MNHELLNWGDIFDYFVPFVGRQRYYFVPWHDLSSPVYPSLQVQL